MYPDRKVLLAGVGAAVCWGSATVLSKGILTYLPPLTLLLLQLCASNIFLWGWIFLSRTVVPGYPMALRLSLTGLLQPGLAFGLGIVGLSLTSVSIEALLWSLETPFILGLAWLLLGERMDLATRLLSALAVVGMLLVTGVSVGDSTLIGNGLILGGTFCAALYTVLTRRLVVDLEPLVLVALNQAMGLAAIGLVWLIAQEPPVSLTPFLWAWALLSGILLHGLPFWLHTSVLKELSASLSALFISLIPVVSIGGAWAFLQETITPWQLLGTVLVLAAVTAVSLRPASP